MSAVISSARRFTLLKRCGISALVLGLAIVGFTLEPASSASSTTTTQTGHSAYAVRILDIDGGTYEAATPLSQWNGGERVTREQNATTTKFLLNTTESAGLSSAAGPDGSEASIVEGTYTLRDRPTVTFTDLQSSCAPDGSTQVSFGELAVDGISILDEDQLDSGYTYDLPSSLYGATRLHIGERKIESNGQHTVTALRIEAEAGASEIWRVQLGVASCSLNPAVVTGVQVTDTSGAEILPVAGVLRGEGTTEVTQVASSDGAVNARGIRLQHLADGSSSVSVESFAQVADPTDPYAEYRWNTIRVYGLNLSVNADGTSRVSFENTGSAVFTNGVWINTGTNHYTGLDPLTGEPRVEVFLNERIPQEDGSILINGLRYHDVTGSTPDATVGQVRWSPNVTPSPTETPTPTAEPIETPDPSATPTDSPEPTNGSPANGLPDRYVYALRADGASVIAPVALLDRQREAESELVSAQDGLNGQIELVDARSKTSPEHASVEFALLRLYPGTSIEIILRDVLLEYENGAIRMQVGPGSSIAGQAIPAGEIAPNTEYVIADRSARVTLNKQIVDHDLVAVFGLEFRDASGLGSTVQAAAINALEINESIPSPTESTPATEEPNPTEIPEPSTGPDPTDEPDTEEPTGTTPSTGPTTTVTPKPIDPEAPTRTSSPELTGGPIDQNDSGSSSGSAGSSSEDGLAATGGRVTLPIALAALTFALGGILLARQYRRTRASR